MLASALRIVVIALVLLAYPAAASAADRVVAEDPSATDVSGFGESLVWSRQAPSGEFRLVHRRNGVIADAPVPSFEHTVDADLGPGRDGGVVAVYARCEAPERCRLFELDLATGRETELSALSSDNRVEFAPSTWRGAYAFTRAERFSPSEREFEGFGIVAFEDGGVFKSGPLRRVSTIEAFETDLRSNRVAFRSGRASVDGSTVVRVKAFARGGGGRTCTVARASGSGGLGEDDAVVTSPVLHGAFVYWAHLVSPGRYSEGTERTTRIRRVRVPDSRCRRRGRVETSRVVLRHPDVFSSVASAGGAWFYTTPQGVSEAIEPLGFASG